MLQRHTHLNLTNTYETALTMPYRPSLVTHYKTAESPIQKQEDVRDTRPRENLLSIQSYYSTFHIIFYLIYIFMLVLAIDVVYTYFNSIDFNNRQKFLTQVQRIR
jgi:hypothetical protein